MTETEMQLKLGKHFGIKNICIPNVLMIGEYRKEMLPEIEKPCCECKINSKFIDGSICNICNYKKGNITQDYPCNICDDKNSKFSYLGKYDRGVF